MKSTKDWIKYFKEEVPEILTSSRWEHSLEVAKIARELATIHNYSDPERAYLAGLVHDITKQKKNKFHEEVFRKSGFLNYQSLPEPAYHAYSAAIQLREEYKFRDYEVIDAVQNHTLGDPAMSLLASVLYVSDFLGSDFAQKQLDYKVWIEKTKENLHYGLYLKAYHVIRDVTSHRRHLHQNTIDLYHFSIQKIGN